jgi:hypothetical protein
MVGDREREHKGSAGHPGKGIIMPRTWLEWLGAMSSFLTILCFVLYLIERRTRKEHDTLMLGFLHGIKPLVEAMSQRPATTGNDWRPLLPQINDMLARLQPSRMRRSGD